MLVRDIREFMECLKKEEHLTSIDSIINTAFVKQFGIRSLSDPLTREDRDFIMLQFQSRWQKVRDTANDYTLNSEGINKVWIELAKKFGSLIKRNYIRILFPDITNSHDFNNSTLLIDTETPHNFYLGKGDKTLFRKRGLCEHLMHRGYQLSTYRSVSSPDRKLYPLTIIELTRLQSCQQSGGDFSIEEESFVNFWDFLKRKSYPMLNPENEVSVEFLPHLFTLLAQYYTLKRVKNGWDLFENASHEFFELLDSSDLENVNLFYGIKIQTDTNEYYLLELLIALNKAKNFDLEEEISILASWLFSFNKELRLSVSELKPLYKRLEGGNHQLITSPSKEDILFSQCMSMLLSMLTLEFKYIPFCGKTIAAWDQENKVCPEISEIYEQFYPFLKENKDGLTALYSRVVQEIIIPASTDVTFFKWLTVYPTTKAWYGHVKQGTLHQLNVNWWEPELLLYALTRFKTLDRSLAQQLNNFLDDLIHTYAIDSMTNLYKQLRVNILFVSFCNEIDLVNKNKLLYLIKLCSNMDVHKEFLANCTIYIGTTLSRMSVHDIENSVHFFGNRRRSSVNEYIFSHKDWERVSDIITLYKDRIHTLENKVAPALFTEMSEYLQRLTRPILTREEVEEAKKSVRSLDYLGAPT